MINTVPPVAGAKAGANAPKTVPPPGGELGKEAFLKLFIAQLKNQDPLNPMDGQQFAAQLAQFSSVEQLTTINQQLTDQATLGQAIASGISTSNAIGAIGHTVTATGNQVLVGSGDDPTVTANIGGPGATVTLRILDDSGKTIASRALGSVSAGRHTFELGDAADHLAPGVYHYAIDVSDSSGAPVTVQTYTVAQIDGIASSANGPILRSGPLEIPLTSVVEIDAEH